MKKMILFCLLSLVVFISSCGSNYYPASDTGSYEMRDGDEIVAEDAAFTSNNREAAAGQQRIIRNANLNIDVQDVTEAADGLTRITGELQGYISEANIYSISEDRQAGRYIIRVPENTFDEALEAISNLGEVRQKSFSEEDVTLKYIDLEARITNLEAQEARFRELLAEAQNIEEILAVEKELERVRGQLESLQVEFNYLKNKVSFATINISLSEIEPSALLEPGSLSTGQRLSQLFIANTNRLIRGLASTLVFTIGILPLLLPFIILGFGICYLIRKRRRAKQTKQP